MIEYWIDIPNLQTVNLPDSFQYVQSKSFNSMDNDTNEWIDVHSKLIDILPHTLDDIDPNSTSILISNGSYTDMRIFDLSRFILLEELIIEDNCFSNVDIFKIDGLNYLKSIKIGIKSFTQQKDNWNTIIHDDSRSFAISNCAELKSIEIGRYSFSGYSGLFELKNLPSLISIKIGSIESGFSNSNHNGRSFNFFVSSFVVKGIIDMILLMNRSSTFEFDWIRS